MIEQPLEQPQRILSSSASETSETGAANENVLLSFAQFEREVTAERVRDKVAASKRKGMWMGGAVPNGYDARNKALVVNAAEADAVRTIFREYLALGAVPVLRKRLATLGDISKRRTDRHGRMSGGGAFSTGGALPPAPEPGPCRQGDAWGCPPRGRPHGHHRSGDMAAGAGSPRRPRRRPHRRTTSRGRALARRPALRPSLQADAHDLCDEVDRLRLGPPLEAVLVLRLDARGTRG